MINENNGFDFYPLGQAIKDGRNKQKTTREALAEKLGINDRYLAQIENEGVNPGFELFYTLITMFGISVDQYFYPNRAPAKNTRRRQIEQLMDGFDEADLVVMESTANGICKAKGMQSRDGSLEHTLSYSVVDEP